MRYVRYVTLDSLWFNIGLTVGLGVPLVIIVVIIIIIIVDRLCRRRRNKRDAERDGNSNNIAGSTGLHEDNISTVVASESGYSENEYTGPRRNENRHYSAIGLPVPATRGPTSPQYLSVM